MIGPRLVIGELESLGKETATVFRLAPWTYTAASPTAWSRSAFDGRTLAAYRGVSTPQGAGWLARGHHGSNRGAAQAEESKWFSLQMTARVPGHQRPLPPSAIPARRIWSPIDTPLIRHVATTRS